jgi:hypothetical protein
MQTVKSTQKPNTIKVKILAPRRYEITAVGKFGVRGGQRKIIRYRHGLTHESALDAMVGCVSKLAIKVRFNTTISVNGEPILILSWDEIATDIRSTVGSEIDRLFPDWAPDDESGPLTAAVA